MGSLTMASLQAITIKLSVKQPKSKIMPKSVDETRRRTQVRYNRLKSALYNQTLKNKNKNINKYQYF